MAHSTAAITGHFAHDGAPSPVGSGRMTARPTAAGRAVMASIPRILPKADSGLPMLGDTCSVRMLFIQNQPATVRGTRKTSHTKPALWIQVSVPAAILPIRVPDVCSSTMPPPPNTARVMTRGMRICMVVTPALPSPALRPRARPCIRLG